MKIFTGGWPVWSSSIFCHCFDGVRNSREIFLKKGHHNEQKKETRKGTLKSVRTPLIKVAGIISGPQLLVIPGRQTSIEVAPAAATAAYGPSFFAKNGVNIKAISSLKILESNAIAPKAGFQSYSESDADQQNV